MASDGEGAAVHRPFRERFFGAFKFSNWLSKRISRRREKRKAKSAGASTKKSNKKQAPNLYSMKKPVNVVQSMRKPVNVVPPEHQHQQQQQRYKTANSFARNQPVAVLQQQRQQQPQTKLQQQIQQQIQQQEQQLQQNQFPRPAINPQAGARIANYDPQMRRGSSATMYSRNGSTTMKRGNSRRSASVPVSGELAMGGGGGSTGGASMSRSSSSSLSKLRDQYVRVMLKLGDMSNSVSLGNSVTFESQVFESEVFRRRAQMDNEVMDLYLNSSIQPSEWKDAHMGSRVMRNGSIVV